MSLSGEGLKADVRAICLAYDLRPGLYLHLPTPHEPWLELR